jgi:fatty-acyl-CoA synthase
LLLQLQAQQAGGAIFLSYDRRQWTYAEVDQQATTLARGLLRLGLQPGDRLSVILPNLPEYVLALFAAARAGLVLTPVNARRHAAEVGQRLRGVQPAAVITLAESAGMLAGTFAGVPGLRHVVAVGGQGPGLLPWGEVLRAGADAADDLPAPSPGEVAAVLYTLGKCGEPRGAMLTHGALARNAADIAAGLRCTPQDVFLGAVPFSNAFGLTATILACAAAGARLALLPVYSPAEALAVIGREQVTIHHGVPTMFALELNEPALAAAPPRSLRAGIVSGAPCPPELVARVRQQMGCQLILAYGLTEAAPSVTMTHLDDGPITASQTVGRPMPGVRLKVVDTDGAELPAGAAGELCVQGYNVMRGYWNDPDATAQVLDPSGWLATGDLAVIDPDGPVRILGRKDEVINRGGFKFHPQATEMVLRLFPGVREVAVVGAPDAIYGELPTACVVRAPGAAFTADELLAFAAERLTPDAVPARVLFFEALPRRGSGPVLKEVLRQRARIRGQAWTFGKNIDTDAIIPARHCNTADPRQLAQHCMEDADPAFVRRMRRGDVIVADSNFGCGSSREVAPISIRAAGVSAVIARSFARIFFRNAVNIGLPILECPAAADGIQAGDEVEVEPATGAIRNLTRGQTYQAEPFPSFLQHIIERGGLLAYVEDRLAAGASPETNEN